MNKFGIYYGYWTRDWIVDFAQYVRRAEGLGFDIIEFDLGAVMDAPREYQDRLRGAVREHEMETTFCIGLPLEMDISSGDSRVRNRGIEFLKEALERARELGGTALGGIIYGSWGATLSPGERDKRPHLERSIESMRRVAIRAKEVEVRCNVEVVNRFESCLLNTAAEAVEYVDAVDSPWVGIHLDTFHMNIEEDSLPGAIRMAGDRLGHFHVGENNRRLPGEGDVIRWPEVMGALSEIGYGGPVVMEPFVLDGGDIAQDIKLWRDLSAEDPDRRALRAREFLADLMG